jgi:uncharacterized OB-fold protein
VPASRRERPLPDVHEPSQAPFWAGLLVGEIRAERCSSCGRFRWPPLPVCPHCGSRQSEWAMLPGEGTIWSHATYHRAFHPAFEADIPYTVALVDVVPGVRQVGRVAGPREAIGIGRRVVAVFEAVTPEVTLLSWRLVE